MHNIATIIIAIIIVGLLGQVTQNPSFLKKPSPRLLHFFPAYPAAHLLSPKQASSGSQGNTYGQTLRCHLSLTHLFSAGCRSIQAHIPLEPCGGAHDSSGDFSGSQSISSLMSFRCIKSSPISCSLTRRGLPH